VGKDIFLYVVSLNLACFVLSYSGALPLILTGYTSPESFSSLFTIENVNLTNIGIATIGSIAAGLLAIFTKNYVFGAGAILIWVVSVLLGPVGWVINGFPSFIRSLIYVIGGSSASSIAVGYMAFWVATVLCVYGMFMFIVEILAGRQMQ